VKAPLFTLLILLLLVSSCIGDPLKGVHYACEPDVEFACPEGFLCQPVEHERVHGVCLAPSEIDGFVVDATQDKQSKDEVSTHEEVGDVAVDATEDKRSKDEVSTNEEVADVADTSDVPDTPDTIVPPRTVHHIGWFGMGGSVSRNGRTCFGSLSGWTQGWKVK